MKEYGQARTKVWRGRAEKVRRLLAEGPMSIEELAEALGEPLNLVAHTVRQMRDRNGGVMDSPDEPGKVERFRPAPKAAASARVAGPVTIGRGLRWFVESR
jgi:hypothetical protein